MSAGQLAEVWLPKNNHAQFPNAIPKQKQMLRVALQMPVRSSFFFVPATNCVTCAHIVSRQQNVCVNWIYKHSPNPKRQSERQASEWNEYILAHSHWTNFVCWTIHKILLSHLYMVCMAGCLTLRCLQDIQNGNRPQHMCALNAEGGK